MDLFSDDLFDFVVFSDRNGLVRKLLCPSGFMRGLPCTLVGVTWSGSGVRAMVQGYACDPSTGEQWLARNGTAPLLRHAPPYSQPYCTHSVLTVRLGTMSGVLERVPPPPSFPPPACGVS